MIENSFEVMVLNIDDKYTDLAMSRSKFMLRNFVLGMHGKLCPKTVYQILLELKVLADELNRILIEKEEVERNINDWMGESKQKVVDQTGNIKFIYPDLEVKKCQRKIKNLECDYIPKKREFDWLYNLLMELPAYTVEDMEKDEPRYWNQRYVDQLIEGWQSTHTGFDRGDLMSLRYSASIGFADDLEKLPPIILPSDMLVNLLVKIIPPQYEQQLIPLVETIMLGQTPKDMKE